MSETRARRWTAHNTDGVVRSRPGRLYYARLVAITSGSADIVAILRDGTTATDPLILALDVVAGRPDDWPVVPVSLPFATGLYVTFSGGTSTTRVLLLAWDED